MLTNITGSYVSLFITAPSPVQVVVAETSLQEPFSPVYQLTLDPSIDFESLSIRGTGSGLFEINQTSLMVSSIGAVPPGRYSLNIIITFHDMFIFPLPVPFTVDVTPEGRLEFLLLTLSDQT